LLIQAERQAHGGLGVLAAVEARAA